MNEITLSNKFSEICKKNPNAVVIYTYDPYDDNGNNTSHSYGSNAFTLKTTFEATLESKSKNYQRSFTYQDLYSQAIVLANYFISCNIQPNDTIAIVLENRPEWAITYFAILFSGAIAVPLDPQANIHDLEYFCQDAKCKIIITSHNYIEKLRPLTQQIFTKDKNKVVLLNAYKTTNQPTDFDTNIDTNILVNYDDIIINQIPNFNDFHDFNEKNLSNFPQRQSNDVASIVYTSGTTGKYKGVMLSHANLYANYASLTNLNIDLKQQHFLSLLPLHHTFPFMATLLVPIFAQGTVTYLNDLKPTSLIKCLHENAITILVGVPQLFYMLHNGIKQKIAQLSKPQRFILNISKNIVWILRYTLNVNCGKLFFKPIHQTFGTSLQYLLSGGAKLDHSIARDFLQFGFNLIEGYGLTETSPVVAFNDDKIHKMQSVGKAIPQVKIKIIPSEHLANKNNISSDDTKKITEQNLLTNAEIALPNNTQGEIVIQGPNVMLGYYQHSEATNEAIKNNWFHTGDLGYLDKQGYLYITGRSKEIIVLSSGKNISPEELEHYYTESPFIKELAITVVDINTHTKLMAIVVPNIDYCKKVGKVDVYTNIKEELELKAKNLPSYKRVMGFILTAEDLPRTRLGKLRRFIIDQQYADLLRQNPEQKTFVTSSTSASNKNHKQHNEPNNEQSFTTENTAITANTKKPESEFNINSDNQKTDNATQKDAITQKDEITQKILSIIEQHLANNLNSSKQHINTSDHLELDLGIESLSRIELITSLEQQFNIKFELNTLNQIATVQELIDIVKNTPINTVNPANTINSTNTLSTNHTNTIQHIADNSIKTTNNTTNQHNIWHELLQQPITQDLQNKLLLNFNHRQRLTFNICDAFLRSTLKICWRLEVQGIENIPQNQPVIFAPNHTSFLDGPLIAGALPKNIANKTFFVGLTDIFNTGFLKKISQIMKIIPMDPAIELLQALQACTYVLNQQKNVCLFPEGARSINGNLQEFKKGIGILIAETNTPVIPVYIKGAYQALPRTQSIPKFNKITVTFSKPYTKQDLLDLYAKTPKTTQTQPDEYSILAKALEEVCRLAI